MEKLYKKTKTGAIAQWEVFTEGNKYWTEHGQIDGKITVSVPTICEAKNVGRSNEVSESEQAQFVARRKWEDRQKYDGYTTNINDVDKGKSFFECTLAHKWDSHAKKMPENIMGSPKLDGLRCIITKDGAFTRNGKQYVTTKFIEESLQEFFEEYPDIVLDGELYCHRLHNDFNKITSLARKTKEKSIKPEDWDEIKDKLKLYIFDIYDQSEPEKEFTERYEFIQEKFIDAEYLVPVINKLITHDQIDEYHSECIEEGYEGIMLRDPSMLYEHTRSKKLLKYKQFTDDEFKVIDITAGKGIRATMAGRVRCATKDGVEFEAGIQGTHEYFTELLVERNKFIGQMATIRYQNLTPDGKPRFGVMVDIGRIDI
jgi:DNA ligase-1